MKSRPSESSSTAWAWTCRWWATSTTTATLLTQFPECAQALSKYRINPGNMGGGKRRDDNFAQMIEVACRYDKPVRIGVNWGSLDHELMARKMDENNQRAVPWEAQAVMRDALVVSAISNAQRAEELGLRRDAIILSCKVSHVQDLIAVYRDLSARCDYPLHLGLTEAGMGSKGIVASTAALAVLLQQGIGDTIRISLTPEPGGDRTARPWWRRKSCRPWVCAHSRRWWWPAGCGRTSSTFFQELADSIQSYLRRQMPLWRTRYPGVENMNVAVMGCVVNGPGESRHADIGISLPGTGEVPAAPVFVDGERTVTLKGDHIAEEFQAIVEDYVARRYGARLSLKVRVGSLRAPAGAGRMIKMTQAFQKVAAIRGMNDLLPGASARWNNSRKSCAAGCAATAIATCARRCLSIRACSRAASARSPTSSRRRCTPSPTRSTANR